jgi:D-serine deaminase-like pyridoxal phosphate-dependent protein
VFNLSDIISPMRARVEPRSYLIASAEHIQTPALAIYLDFVEHNISTTLRLLGGNPNRWRPHIKTAKIGSVIRRLVEHGVRQFKCATTLELQTACDVGATDVLVAYPCVGARATRVREIALALPQIQISALVENVEGIDAWVGSDVGLFIDVNAGMNRTGVREESVEEILRIANAIRHRGLRFRGLHYYDGHHRDADLRKLTAAAHGGYDHLMAIASHLVNAGIVIEEIVTSGTPSFPAALEYEHFQSAQFLHRVSPGTVVYNDVTSLSQLPEQLDYQPAALVITTVVSRPVDSIVTCDAGHKTVSADSGDPTCAVLGHPELTPIHPSEEHLPMQVSPGARVPEIGEQFYLIPRHVCPTVNNFDHALLIQGQEIVGLSKVSARGREKPIASHEGGA